MHGKVAVVTGGSRGIGAAIARRLAADGAHVAITYRAAADRADQVVRDVAARGVRGLAVRADLAEPDAPRHVVAAVLAEFGRLDVVVNNAGIAPFGPIRDVTPAELDATLAVHARAAFLLAQAAEPHLPDGGRIITIGSSLARRVPYPDWTLYAMSKSALIGLTKGLARDLGPRGITVNLVHPGSTDTEMNPADGPDADAERRHTALGRYLDPDDVAATVAHLAGPGGRGITGAEFAVDAGVTA